jgi:hypothetical protein
MEPTVTIDCTTCRGSGGVDVPTDQAGYFTRGERCPSMRCVEGKVQVTGEEVDALVRWALDVRGMSIPSANIGLTSGMQRRLDGVLESMGWVL